MIDCEFYRESRRSCSAGIEHLRRSCTLTGESCLIDADYESDRVKCERRKWALDYKAKHTRDDEISDSRPVERERIRGSIPSFPL